MGYRAHTPLALRHTMKSEFFLNPQMISPLSFIHSLNHIEILFKDEIQVYFILTRHFNQDSNFIPEKIMSTSQRKSIKRTAERAGMKTTLSNPTSTSNFDLRNLQPTMTDNELLSRLDFSAFSDGADLLPSTSSVCVVQPPSSPVPAAVLAPVIEEPVESSSQSVSAVSALTMSVQPPAQSTTRPCNTDNLRVQAGAGSFKTIHFLDGPIKRLFTDACVDKTIYPDEKDLPYTLLDVFNSLVKWLNTEYKERYQKCGPFKTWISMKNSYTTAISDKEFEMGMTTRAVCILNDFEMKNIVKEKIRYLLERNDNLIREKSSLLYRSTKEIVIKTALYRPLYR